MVPAMRNINTVIASLILLFYGFFYFMKFKELMDFGTTMLAYLSLLTGIIALTLSFLAWEGRKTKYGIYVISILTIFFLFIFYMVEISYMIQYVIPFLLSIVLFYMLRKNFCD